MNKKNNEEVYSEYERIYDWVIFEELLPMIVTMKQKANSETNEVELVPMIMMKDIISLGLTETEYKYLIEYIKEKSIIIVDSNNKVIDELSDYNYYNSFKKAILPTPLTTQENIKKMTLLRITNDPIIREQLIVGNMGLVPYFAWNLSRIYSLDANELEQYGYEGLIFAVDHFKIEKGNTFSTYASRCIKGAISDGVRELIGLGSSKQKSADFLSAKDEIEKKYGIRLEDNLSLIDKNVDLMVEKGNISPKNRDIFIRRFNL